MLMKYTNLSNLILVLRTTMGGGYPPGLGPDGALSTHTPNSLVCLQTSSDILSFRKPSPFAQYHTDLLPKKKKKKIAILI